MKLYALFPFIVASLAADSCNPLKQSCDSDKALGASIKEDFTEESKYFSEKVSHGLSYSSNGVTFRVAEKGDNPSIVSDFYMMFGKVEAVMKAAPGKGIVTSFFLQSDDLDEIDIELLGADTQQWQSNFFSKGNTDSYDRGEFHDSATSLVDEYHTYTIEFTQDTVTFALDGTVMRTLDPNNPQGFPQTPMRIYAGSWAGGDSSNEPGTIEWAGGLTDYSQGPFDMHIKSIIAVDYSSGSAYKYGDQSGSWSSIESVGGKINGRKTQAESEFTDLQNGEDVSNSFSQESSSVPSSTSSEVHSSAAQSTSQSVEASETVHGSSTVMVDSSTTVAHSVESSHSRKASSTSSSSEDVTSSNYVSESAHTASVTSSVVHSSSTLMTSATSKSSQATVSQISSDAASSNTFGVCVVVLTFLGYII